MVWELSAIATATGDTFGLAFDCFNANAACGEAVSFAVSMFLNFVQLLMDSATLCEPAGLGAARDRYLPEDGFLCWLAVWRALRTLYTMATLIVTATDACPLWLVEEYDRGPRWAWDSVYPPEIEEDTAAVAEDNLTTTPSNQMLDDTARVQDVRPGPIEELQAGRPTDGAKAERADQHGSSTSDSIWESAWKSVWFSTEGVDVAPVE